jgi:hypothetical protein
VYDTEPPGGTFLSDFKSKFRVSVVQDSDEEMVFDMMGVDASIANALRRILIAEVRVAGQSRARLCVRVYRYCGCEVCARCVLVSRRCGVDAIASRMRRPHARRPAPCPVASARRCVACVCVVLVAAAVWRRLEWRRCGVCALDRRPLQCHSAACREHTLPLVMVSRCRRHSHQTSLRSVVCASRCWIARRFWRCLAA